METITPAAEDSSGANPSSVKSDDSSPRHESGRGSPPPNCAICLGTCHNKSFTDSCLHQFCFKCLLTWSKVKAECPLCKQVFKSIIHNVRSNHQYDEYTVEQTHEETTATIDIDNMTQFTRRFRYRTTLTLPRRESLAIQQLLLHYPLVADVFPPPSAAARRRSPTSFRRTVYRHNLWARPLPDFTGRFRDCSPQFYRANETQMHRLVPWLNRELHYLLNENAGHISYVMTRILELLPTHHISSTEFREVMQRYFGDRTEHFLHELYCFASTPYDMNGYDRHVQYTTDTRISTIVNEVISSSDSEASVDSDIVMVSQSLPAEPPPGPSTRLPPPPPVYPHNYIPQPAASNVIPIETISQSDSDNSDEVMVVGYIKPPQDRTPEVVDLLGSDSDVMVHDITAPPPGAGESAPPADPAAAAAVPPPATNNLVKVSLTRARRWDSSGSEYAPPPPRRRRRAPATAPAAPAGAVSPADTDADFTASSSSLSFSSSSSYSSSQVRRRRPARKKSKRKNRRETATGDSRRKRRRRSSSRDSRERRGKRKSHSGKGVKRSKRTVEPPEPSRTPPLPPPMAAAAGPSAAPAPAAESRLYEERGRSPDARTSAEPRPSRGRDRRRTGRDNKRLKSVISVINKSHTDSSSSPSWTPSSWSTRSGSAPRRTRSPHNLRSRSCSTHTPRSRRSSRSPHSRRSSRSPHSRCSSRSPRSPHLRRSSRSPRSLHLRRSSRSPRSPHLRRSSRSPRSPHLRRRSAASSHRSTDTDSEENLPLNLCVHKATYRL